MSTSTVKKDPPRDFVLHTKEKTVKFHKHLVIRNKTINKKKMFVNFRDMQNIFKVDGITRASKFSMTNMRNFQTCTICNLNLILPTIALVHRQTVEVAGEVVGGTTIKVPIVVAVTICHHVAAAMVVRLVGVIVAIATVGGVVPLQAAYLAPGWATVLAATTAVVASTVVATVAIGTIVATIATTPVSMATMDTIAIPVAVAVAHDVFG